MDHHYITIPPEVRALGEGACGAPLDAVVPAYGGFSNLTVYALVRGQPVVLKAADSPAKRADLRHEAAILPLLADRALPAPELIALAEGTNWSVLLTRALPGRNGLQMLAESPGELPRLYAALGAILARLHTGLPPPGAELLLATRVAQARAVLPGLGLDVMVHTALIDALAQPIWAAEPPRLLHGDPGLHNLLWNGSTAWLLDWEWATAGPPWFDLAWLHWTIHWRGLPESLWDAVLAVYGRLPPITLIEQRALVLGQIAMILARSHGRPAALEEWARRAAWTISQTFF